MYLIMCNDGLTACGCVFLFQLGKVAGGPGTVKCQQPSIQINYERS